MDSCDRKRQLIELLSKTDPDIEQAMVIKHRLIPPCLYRYRSFNCKSLRDLRDDTVWLTSPNKYKDPYDSALSLAGVPMFALMTKMHLQHMPSSSWPRSVLSDEQFTQILEAENPLLALADILLPEQAGGTDERRRQIVRPLSELARQVASDAARRVSNMNQTDLRVCSFCEVPDSVPMWSNYADGHQGLCIEYPIGTLDPDICRGQVLISD
jgi:hypothetical protein